MLPPAMAARRASRLRQIYPCFLALYRLCDRRRRSSYLFLTDHFDFPNRIGKVTIPAFTADHSFFGSVFDVEQVLSLCSTQRKEQKPARCIHIPREGLFPYHTLIFFLNQGNVPLADIQQQFIEPGFTLAGEPPFALIKHPGYCCAF